jgi:hypothetical protein
MIAGVSEGDSCKVAVPFAFSSAMKESSVAHPRQHLTQLLDFTTLIEVWWCALLEFAFTL